MTVIAAANSSAYNAVASLLANAANIAPDSARANQSAATDQQASSGEPKESVDLSDHAKRVLARAKSEQSAAEKLSDLVQSLQNSNSKSHTLKTKPNDGPSFEDLSGSQASSQTKPNDGPSFEDVSGSQVSSKSGDTQWVAGAPYGDASKSDAEFKKAIMIEFEGRAYVFEREGNWEAAQSIRNGYANGTLKFQRAADVPDLNFTSQNVFAKNAWGTWDTIYSTSSSQNATGSVKEALDQGRAVAMWTPDRGDVYITW
jgi:hypothetical protein